MNINCTKLCYQQTQSLLYISVINRYSQVHVNTKEYMILIHQPHVRNVKTRKNSYKYNSMDTTASMMLKHTWLKFTATLHLNTHSCLYTNRRYRSFRSRNIHYYFNYYLNKTSVTWILIMLSM
jgi:hypothetical protein